ncbi:MAG: hypothetical protein HYZ16_04405 [Bacteroidetes bacterium]|nr:hypothetical protein [Bacteroidota bacterium]
MLIPSRIYADTALTRQAVHAVLEYEKTAMEQEFSNTTHGYTTANGATTTTGAQRLQVTAPGTNAAVYYDFSTQIGSEYKFYVQVDPGTCDSVLIKVQQTSPIGPHTEAYAAHGINEFSFTASSALTRLRILRKDAAGQGSMDYFIDHVRLTRLRDTFYTDTVTLATGEGYKYGNGGQMRDDELYGLGNAYTAMYWEYDSRLGRRWDVDPVTFPWQGSYTVYNNNPVYFNDPLGLWGKRNKAERKQEKMIDKLGKDRVGDIVNRNEGTEEKPDWGFSIFADGKSKHADIEVDGLNEFTISADRPLASLYDNEKFNKVKSDLGLYEAWTVSVSFSFILGGGASYSLGWAQDRFGGRTGFHTIGGGIGLEMGVGINAGSIMNTEKDDFKVDMLKGQGFQYGAWLGPIPIAGTKSGDNGGVIDFRNEGLNYTINEGGLTNDLKMLKLLKLGKLKFGGSYQWNETFLFLQKSKLAN